LSDGDSAWRNVARLFCKTQFEYSNYRLLIQNAVADLTRAQPWSLFDSKAHERVICGVRSLSAEVRVEDKQSREEFDTALARIRHDIKGRLVIHGFFGSVTYRDIQEADDVLSGSTIEVTVKGRTAKRSYSRQEIEDCRLRVSGAVLLGVISMVDELSAPG
jgi:hypothetical protein